MLKRLESFNAPAAIGSYSVATVYQGIIYTSGQLPINPETGVFPSQKIEEQARQSLLNIKAILEENHSNMNRIIKTTVYLEDIADFKSFDAVYKTFFDGNYPSRTAFEVGKLPMNAKIEIEVMAACINEDCSCQE